MNNCWSRPYQRPSHFSFYVCLFYAEVSPSASGAKIYVRRYCILASLPAHLIKHLRIPGPGCETSKAAISQPPPPPNSCTFSCSAHTSSVLRLPFLFLFPFFLLFYPSYSLSSFCALCSILSSFLPHFLLVHSFVFCLFLLLPSLLYFPLFFFPFSVLFLFSSFIHPISSFT